MLLYSGCLPAVPAKAEGRRLVVDCWGPVAQWALVYSKVCNFFYFLKLFKTFIQIDCEREGECISHIRAEIDGNTKAEVVLHLGLLLGCRSGVWLQCESGRFVCLSLSSSLIFPTLTIEFRCPIAQEKTWWRLNFELPGVMRDLLNSTSYLRF